MRILHSVVLWCLTMGCCLTPACKSDHQKEATHRVSSHPQLSVDRLAGNWVAKSQINRIKNLSSVAQSLQSPLRPFCFAFTLAPEVPDSMMCYTGEKYWRLPLRFSQDTLIVPAGKDGAPVYMVYSEKPERSFMVYDLSNGQMIQNYFVALKEKTTNGLSAFFAALNLEWIAGKYRWSGGGTEVTLFPTGIVTGLPGIDIYQICLGGECQIAGERVDLIYLMNKNKQLGEWHAFHFLEDDTRLQIFELKKNPNSSPEFVVGKLKYDLTRVKKDAQ